MRLEDICTVFTDGDWIESKDQSESGIRLVPVSYTHLTLCEKYGIQIRSLSPIKEAFSEFQFHKKIYPLFFRGNIFSVDDIRNKSAHDLYDICEQDYCLTMKTYYALRKNGVMLCGWNDQYLFEILPQYKSVRLFK